MKIDRTTLSQIISKRAQMLELDSFSPSDWELLMKEAQAEGVGPLSYWALTRSGNMPRLPQVIAHALRAMYFSTRMNNEQIIQELVTLTKRFDEAGIPAVALKGACFALTIYPDLGLRPMVDLDLLVPASKLSEAMGIARSTGYREARPEAAPGLDGLLEHAICLKKVAIPFSTLELHSTLVAEGSFTHAVPVDWFWSQTEPIIGLSSTRAIPRLLMLTPTAQVLYACAHAMLQHGGRNTSLRWLYDLDRLICVYAKRIDWDLLLAQAQVFEWSSAAFAALSQVVRLFDTPVPQNVIEDLSKQPDRNTERVRDMQEQPATHILEEYQKLKSLNGYARFRFIMALAIPSPAYMRWRYGLRSAWALPGYYLYRWWGILKDALSTVVHLIQKSRMGKRQPQKAG